MAKARLRLRKATGFEIVLHQTRVETSDIISSLISNTLTLQDLNRMVHLTLHRLSVSEGATHNARRRCSKEVTLHRRNKEGCTSLDEWSGDVVVTSNLRELLATVSLTGQNVAWQHR